MMKGEVGYPEFTGMTAGIVKFFLHKKMLTKK
jgi:hypothetical protein